MKGPLNIALLGRDFSWSGGMELLRILANALLSLRDERRLKLFLLLPVRNRVDNLADLRFVVGAMAERLLKQRKFSLLKREPQFEGSVYDYFKNVDGKIEIIEYNEATGLIPSLNKIEADVVLPASQSLGGSFPIPWVGYIYDFQHKYFPEYFTPKECLRRDINFATMLRDAKSVIVNSKATKSDIDKYFPYHNTNVFNLPFSASPVEAWLNDSEPGLLDHYKLPAHYFLISNQFWIHKSHITAFKALAKLIKEPNCFDLHIVCTGKLEEHRFPSYIDKLKVEIRALEVEDRIHFLGHIPKADQIAIMKNSLAVIQPTLFEGGPGGGAVYDAISLGVPAIISNIQVNKEIENEKNIFYFNSESDTDLAEKILDFLKRDIKRPEKENLVEMGEQRKFLLGTRLLESIKSVIN